jgi:hypothetical protein
MEARAAYPPELLTLILVFGISLAFFRPFMAYLFSIFVTMSANYSMMTFTRLPGTGEYFNAHDACLLIVLVAALSYAFKVRKVIIHPVLLLISTILGIGFAMALSYDTNISDLLRPLRWAITLPIYLWSSSLLVDSQERLQRTLFTILLASLCASIQHFFYVLSIGFAVGFDSPNLYRTVYYTQAAGIVFTAYLLTEGNLKLILGNFGNYVFSVVICIIILCSYLLNQTRSFLIAFVITILFSIGFYTTRIPRLMMRFAIGAFILVLLITFVGQFTSDFNLGAILGRFGSLESSARTNALNTEIEDWFASPSTVMLGNGIAYFTLRGDFQQSIDPNDYVAWGHLGYITTLSQLGIAGFIVYYVLLPISIVSAVNNLRKSSDEVLRSFSILVTLYSVYIFALHLMSGTFLQQQTAIYGVLFGTAWRLSQLTNVTTKFSAAKDSPLSIDSARVGKSV